MQSSGSHCGVWGGSLYSLIEQTQPDPSLCGAEPRPEVALAAFLAGVLRRLDCRSCFSFGHIKSHMAFCVALFILQLGTA